MQGTIPVAIVSVEEPWAKATLSNGDTVRVKTVFVKIERVIGDDGKPASNADGTPAYNVGSQVMYVSEAKKVTN